MLAILKKELSSYFNTSVAYVFIGMFSIIAGAIFAVQNLNNLSSDIPAFLAQLNLMLLFLTPVLTMKTYCDEFNLGTYKLLFSMPVSASSIVFGKFIAAAIVTILALSITLIFTIITAFYGVVYFPETFLAYIGFYLQALALLAIDMFISSFSKNQISAILMAFSINLLLWLLDILAKSTTATLNNVLNFISIYKRIEPFMIGQISISSIVFFIVCIACFIYANIYRLKKMVYGGWLWNCLKINH